MDTREKIEQILTYQFAPTQLEVIDESYMHKGHQGNGHFKVIMKSQKFNGLTAVEGHRLVYQALNKLMESQIHALSMDLSS